MKKIIKKMNDHYHVIAMFLIALITIFLAAIFTTYPKNNKPTFASMIPDLKEYFFNTEFEMVTNEDIYTVYLDYVTKEEWDAYIAKCKERIWLYETYSSDYSWYADSKDQKYQIFLDRYGNDHEYMTITVKVKEKKNNE